MRTRGYAVEALLAAVAACWIAPSWAAAPAKEYSLNIPRQSLDQAIIDFDTQTGLSGGVTSETAAEATVYVGPLCGKYSADGALRVLLEPIGFTHEWTDDHTISVRKKGATGKKKKSRKKL